MNTPARRIPLPQADVRALEQIYATLPAIQCQRKCQRSCGPIGMTLLERNRIVRHVGRPPEFDRNLHCTLLVDGACSAYAVRPLICRLWGLVPKMACPWGCVPERWLSDDEVKAFLFQSEKIGGRVLYASPAKNGGAA